MRGKQLKTAVLALALAALALPAQEAHADELFTGLYAHDVDTGLTKSGIEDGVDIELGWRGDRLRALRFVGAPSPHAFVSINSAGDTNFAALGISWKIGRTVYVRPGVGLAIHDSPSRVAPGVQRIDFGSRILFEPEIGVGVQAGERLSVEASWVHLSHAQLFSAQNPGIDTIGVRLNLKL